MSGEIRFLVVEDDEDGGFLIYRAMTKMYPKAEVCTFDDCDVAVHAAKQSGWRAFIVHRSRDADGIGVVQKLRGVDASVPIVMISGRDQAAAAQAAGATDFVRYSDWQTLGQMLNRVLTPS